ncbi:MAG TPA: hypothetical protein VE030_11375 [Burkholderiales bacterium]|nr:hypothetical protein [Burkholderiales bacterium]
MQNPKVPTVRVVSGHDLDLSRRSALRLLRLLERLAAKRLAREAKRDAKD